MTDQEEKAESALPILYSFRRCPYAMRARLALTISHQKCALREIVLRDKPTEMITLSPKATVPVLRLTDGQVLEESLDIMYWALERNDPQQWLIPLEGTLPEMQALIAQNDGPFKHHLDRYKYVTRHEEGADPIDHRTEAARLLNTLNDRLENSPQLFGDRPTLADYAIIPFVRQFANTDRAWFDTQPFRELQQWLDSHLNSEIFLAIMKKWPVWAPGDQEPIFPA
jgi:glutathione S-transferase